MWRRLFPTGIGTVVALLAAAPVAADSSFDDWRDAVCLPGTYSETTGSLMRSAIASASCLSRFPDAQSRPGAPLTIAIYSSRAAARSSELRLFPPTTCFASKEVGDGQIIVFLNPAPGGCAAPAHLAQVFGFMVTPDSKNPVPE